jgi:hypothetical protein
MFEDVTISLSPYQAKCLLDHLLEAPIDANRGHYMKAIYKICDQLADVTNADPKDYAEKISSLRSRRYQLIRPSRSWL